MCNLRVCMGSGLARGLPLQAGTKKRGTAFAPHPWYEALRKPIKKDIDITNRPTLYA